jgi:dihydropteroate synthase
MIKNTTFLPNLSIKVQGRLLILNEPKLMAIFNLTPDSFSDGGKLDSIDKVLVKAAQDLESGADILDLGASSTRPGAKAIDSKTEWERLKPALIAIRKKFPEAILSVDTYRAEIAHNAVSEGADIINDVYGGNEDPHMFERVANLKVPYILMHSRGNSETMHSLHHYDSLIVDIIDDLQKKVYLLRSLQVRDIILDPGFGFAKTISQNYQLLRELSSFSIFEMPILIGISRKSMIYKPLNILPEEAVNGSTAAHILALQGGAHILRVHDVKPAQEARTIWNLYQKKTC